MKSYVTYIGTQLRLLTRDGSVLFFTFLFPLLFFFIFGQTMGGAEGRIAQVVNMVLVMGLLGGGFFGAGMRAVMDREQNILRRFKVAPITPMPIIVSSFVTGLVTFMPISLFIITMAHYYYHMPWPEKWFSLIVMLVVGVVAFRAMGMMIASVANSMQESQIVIQLIYFPMLFLSGATFPLSMMPNWLQSIAQFMPSTHLFMGMQTILIQKVGLLENSASLFALVGTTLVGMFVAFKLFRWEKEEKIANSAKAWIVAVFLPFFLIGGWQLHSKQNLSLNKMLERDMRRNHTLLVKNVRVFIGDGSVLERASVLLKAGKIEQIYTGEVPTAKSLGADEEEDAGKTLMPGLIDVHTHLSAPGGFTDRPEFYNPELNVPRRLAAYLYSGVTAVKSVGDGLGLMESQAKKLSAGEQLGTELYYVGPMFTTEGGHGTEFFKMIPEPMRTQAMAQTLRMPKTAAEAAKQVAELKPHGVTGIKAILESSMNRMDLAVYKAIAAEAKAQNLPVVTHTGDLRDIEDAIEAGTTGIEHGSQRQAIPPEMFAQMKAQKMYYDPTLSVYDAINQVVQGKTDLLDRSLMQGAGPLALLQSSKEWIQSGKLAQYQQHAAAFAEALVMAKRNLMEAWRSGVTLVTGSDAGNAIVMHGPTVQHEVELWVDAGIPMADALKAATGNAARLLRADDRIGFVKKGYEATLLLVDGNPLKDVNAIESVSRVFLKGERVDRTELFDDYDKQK